MVQVLKIGMDELIAWGSKAASRHLGPSPPKRSHVTSHPWQGKEVFGPPLLVFERYAEYGYHQSLRESLIVTDVSLRRTGRYG